MIVYRSNKASFVKQAKSGNIADYVYSIYLQKIGKSNDSQIRSWRNSLLVMSHVIDTPAIPDDASICIEYKLPSQNSRIDFLIAGKDRENRDKVVIIELKQWDNSSVRPVEQKDLVEVFINRHWQEVVHPSYQAWSYAVTLEDYNDVVQEESIRMFPCAYLHNYARYDNDTFLNIDCYPEITAAPVFTKFDEDQLREFILKNIAAPDTSDIMRRIENGKIRPSKSLQDVIGSLLRGNKEFILMDSQKKVYENLMYHFRHMLRSPDEGKNVFIINGGPGTGKTVLALNLLASIIQMDRSAAYVTKNSAPRNVYEAKLSNDRYTKVRIHSLLLNSGKFINAPKDCYDVLIVDEAHRLTEKSGMYNTDGENQIKEIINAARMPVFFIDERQIVTSRDIGSVSEIRRHAKAAGATVYTTTLLSQFRCNGSDGYLAFLDDVLDICHDEEYLFNPGEYHIEVIDDPNSVMEVIRRRNLEANKSRVLAGYCWKWISKDKTGRNQMDIRIPEKNFEAQWNSQETKTWAIDQDSVSQIGCIHTSQGLEFDYAGVIIGDDLRYENGRVITDYSRRASTDHSLFGLKDRCRRGEPEALAEADAIIRNTYKTLLSRGMKGTYLYCTDSALSDYLKARIAEATNFSKGFGSDDFSIADKLS